ncbi:NAD(P)(+) transhydrogenase (Re/Si-specific) subunit beta [Aurantibacter crassamenti]|uniref:NAD(P)(+) transhydrogenase (Re/Si-specific) subunit beta n=1 Tax=Aurantibacter crassamenti TaxID=1837375 RepID=UPI001939AC0D|nr:NAD(P)(+) transhydrogenase (Re/Si-specific) subunit beta [Aurantibacter crassamenti]MBM1106239.1 NAD(P)(+) transhydrogenase (Re/Si-specific) subunit beta [Aurantibacter crassamenti]
MVVLDFILFIAAVLLIIGLRKLSHPDSASRGNTLAAIALALGVVVALIYPLETQNNNYLFIGIGILVGAIIGIISARKVAMTAMPEMVSLFNGFGGLSAGLISLVWLINNGSKGEGSDLGVVLFNLFLGLVAFSGSMIAYGKLSGKLKDEHLKIPFSTVVNILLLIVTLGAIFYFSYLGVLSTPELIAFLVISFIYGVVFVAPIGGADMPVVISTLNSLTGITAAVSGIITDNKLMLLGGVLVGSSGIILTLLMCKAMNRPLLSVIFGNFSSSKGEEKQVHGNAKEVTAADLAVQLAYSQRVCVVPGYGMAVAQAQKILKEVEEVLEDKDVEFKYAIHPVAGRMPGHMNVLLAEANVSYDKLLDLDDANNYLDTTDVAIIVGANDVVNPSALDDPASKIYGMPILNLAKTKNVVVLKRSMNPGYAGIQNPLFFKDNTKMLFGDAKKSIEHILRELKEV